MVYSLFGIIQIIVKYFETFYTLFVQFYPSFHWKTVISPASILEIELAARVKSFEKV